MGQAPKVYEPSGLDVRVSIPQREHGFLASILMDAVRGQVEGESGRDAAVRAAGERGRALGEAESRPVRGGRLGVERALTCAAEVLERHGFEPEREGPARLWLRNCPFHPLAGDDPDLVCGVNHAFLAGMVDGLGASAIEAVLAPGPGRCCVEFGPAGP
ncbi:hypothetical protein [Actinomadura sp. B10D3]|uniref:hypothetical protein n=1 Tax=Actinomadura sp. B10D3 TaxID=3153557 RepID=UPI00325DCD4F